MERWVGGDDHPAPTVGVVADADSARVSPRSIARIVRRFRIGGRERQPTILTAGDEKKKGDADDGDDEPSDAQATGRDSEKNDHEDGERSEHFLASFFRFMGFCPL